jgi:hypothetical protein
VTEDAKDEGMEPIETEADTKRNSAGYLVLRQITGLDTETGETEGWVVVRDVTTVREAFEKHGEGTYVRVPKRSWKPQAAKVEQVSRVKIG